MTDRRPPWEDDGAEADAAVEQRLRAAMDREARQIRPANRLDEIRSAVARPAHRSRLHARVTPLVAAAAIAAMAVAGWYGLRPGPTIPNPVATTSRTPPATASPAPTASGTTALTATNGPTDGTSTPSLPPVTPAAVAVALPVFYLAPDPAAVKPSDGLVRQFVQAQMTADADAGSRVKKAVVAAVTLPTPNLNGFLQVWPAGETIGAVTVAPDHISVDLSAPGRTGLPAALQRLAVQQLVWTATAAAGQDAPVTISVVGGNAIFETVPSGTFTRPVADQAYTEIAPIWIDSPYVGQSYAAGATVVVKGQACVYEAAVAWELRQGDVVVRSGSTTASFGCPQQGSWSVDLGSLPNGAYELRGLEHSAKDGSVSASTVVTFTVGLVP